MFSILDTEEYTNNFALFESSAYRDKVDVSLFNQAAGFISEFIDYDKTPMSVMNLPVIWYQKLESSLFREKYSFKYLGELLDGYEEVMGSDIRVMRSIALVYACFSSYIDDKAFIENEEERFIKRIQERANLDNDLYLYGALYLIFKGTDREKVYKNSLLVWSYELTEDFVFAISLFGDPQMVIDKFGGQVISLLSETRTISSIGNMAIYGWVINELSPIVKEQRVKGMGLIRSLAALANGQLKQDGKDYKLLIQHGYTQDEILYSNIIALLSQEIYGKYSKASSVTERAAVEFVVHFLNSNSCHQEQVYGIVQWVLRMYKSFDIKISGYCGIFDAIKDRLNIVCPSNFILLHRVGLSQLFLYSICNAGWDVIYADLGYEEFTKAFSFQLVAEAGGDLIDLERRELLKEGIDRFKSITGNDYLDRFNNNNFDVYREFCLFANNDLISLEELAQQFLSGTIQCDTLFKGYIADVKTYQAFKAIKVIFDNCDDETLCKLLHDDLSRVFYGLYNAWSRAGINIERDFLTTEEHLQLFEYLDRVVFLTQVKNYLDFLLKVLTNNFLVKIMPQEDLRYIFDSLELLKDSEFQRHKSQIIKYVYTEEEYVEYQNQMLLLREQKKLEDENARRNELYNAFIDQFDNTFQSISKFLNHHQYRGELVMEVVLPTLEKLHTEYKTWDKDEIIAFLNIGKFMIAGDIWSLDKFKEYIGVIEGVC